MVINAKRGEKLNFKVQKMSAFNYSYYKFGGLHKLFINNCTMENLAICLSHNISVPVSSGNLSKESG